MDNCTKGYVPIGLRRFDEYSDASLRKFEEWYYSRKQHKPMLDMDELLKLADYCDDRVEFGEAHVSNGLSHDYYGDVLHKVASKIRDMCGKE